MDITRFKDIIEYNREHSSDMASKVRLFRYYMGLSGDVGTCNNIMQIARAVLRKRNCMVLEFPFDDNEIGAMSYKGDCMDYVLINSSLPRTNVNFAVCHETYHIIHVEGRRIPRAELADRHYFENEAEYAANLFAEMILMPEPDFRNMYKVFKEESNGNEIETYARLMNYYQVPYMAALIRAYELGLPAAGRVTEQLLSVDMDRIKSLFSELWLDDMLLAASRRDDFDRLEAYVKQMGERYVQDEYMNKRTLSKALDNMKRLHADIKGAC